MPWLVVGVLAEADLSVRSVEDSVTLSGGAIIVLIIVLEMLRQCQRRLRDDIFVTVVWRRLTGVRRFVGLVVERGFGAEFGAVNEDNGFYPSVQVAEAGFGAPRHALGCQHASGQNVGGVNIDWADVDQQIGLHGPVHNNIPMGSRGYFLVSLVLG